MKWRFLAGAALAVLTIATPVSIVLAQTSPAAVPPGCEFPVSPPPPNASASDFASYGWRMFIALNWTPKAGQRGEPDCAKPIGSGSATVWQTYKQVDEIFLPNARNPGPWNTPSRGLSLRQTAKASDAVLKSPFGSVIQPVGGWLTDQFGNPTYYEIAVNRASYDYIVANQLYNANIANANRAIAFPDGTVEVKAAWRILTKGNDDFTRYLTRSATVATFDANGKPTGTAAATIGLVALHITVKPKGYPQWIWSTFEQVDNVTAPPAGKASYADPKAPPAAVNQSPCQVGVLPCTPKPGNTFQTSDPLTRVTAIAPDVANVNQTVQALYSGAFVRYYELVGTQRPADPADPGNPLGTPTPNILANVTLESYIQPTSSCMACHSTAVSGGNRFKSDFSFLFIHAQAPQAGH
jgi:hypothetical protein